MHTTRRWSDIYDKPLDHGRRKFQVHVEASTRCNSRCVFCPRFIDLTPVTDPSLVLDEIKLDRFKLWFTPSILKDAYRFHFCGNFGDPTACTELDKIVEYLAENSSSKIIVRTNGGARNVKFWQTLGKHLNSPDRNVVFSVDGLEDTNHLYRREVKWDNIIKNIETFVSAGGYCEQDFLVFKHNEHQLEEAEALASKLGIKKINLKTAFGFDWESDKAYVPVPALDKNGDLTHWLEKPELHKLAGYSDSKFSKEYMLEHMQTQTKALLANPGSPREDIITDEFSNQIERSTIKCFAHRDPHSEFYLNPDGTLAPCCHMAFLKQSKLPTDDHHTRENLKPYTDLNLNFNSLPSILKILDTKIADKWNVSHKEGRSITCSKTCGVRESNIRTKKNITAKKLLV